MNRSDAVGLEELKAYMRYKDISQREMAKVINVTPATFNLKINEMGNSQFTLSELKIIGEYLNLDRDQLMRFFFADNLHNARLDK